MAKWVWEDESRGDGWGHRNGEPTGEGPMRYQAQYLALGCLMRMARAMEAQVEYAGIAARAALRTAKATEKYMKMIEKIANRRSEL